MASVASELGLDRSMTPEEVVVAWPVWRESHPELGVVEATGLRGWLNRVPAQESDRVLLVLARRASPEGEGDPVAALALVWMLLPGASRLASRYWWVPDIDFIVAEQLWLWSCAFPWQTTTKVAANIMGRLPHPGGRESGRSSRPDPNDRLNASTVRYVDALEVPASSQSSPADELRELLDHAVGIGVLSEWARWFLLVVVETAWECEDAVGVPAGLGGLGSPDLCVKSPNGWGCRHVRFAGASRSPCGRCGGHCRAWSMTFVKLPELTVATGGDSLPSGLPR